MTLLLRRAMRKDRDREEERRTGEGAGARNACGTVAPRSELPRERNDDDGAVVRETRGKERRAAPRETARSDDSARCGVGHRRGTPLIYRADARVLIYYLRN